MEQHPVPQNVTSFQFRLIGDMTIKQFGYLAVFAIIGYICYKLPLPIFLTLPLGVGMFLFGFGLAFVPIEERPMDAWVLSFIKSIYSPTQYVWHREKPLAEPVAAAGIPPAPKAAAPAAAPVHVQTVQQISQTAPAPVKAAPTAPPAQTPQVMAHTPPVSPPARTGQAAQAQTTAAVSAPQKSKKAASGGLFGFFHGLFAGTPKKTPPPAPVPHASPAPSVIVTQGEKPQKAKSGGFFAWISGLFGASPAPKKPVPPPPKQAKPPGPPAPVMPPARGPDVFANTPTPQLVKEHLDLPNEEPGVPQEDTEKKIREAEAAAEARAQEKTRELQEKMTNMQKELQTNVVSQDRILELQKQLTDVLSEKNRMEAELRSLRNRLSESRAPAPATKQAGVTTAGDTHGATVKVITAETAVRAGLPSLTTYPNVVTGIIKDFTGSLLPGVLVTVRDREGTPVRALKTNKLGQFAASTPLPNNTYVIEVEDPRNRFVFDRIQVTLNGGIVPAVEIIAKSERELSRKKLEEEIFGGQNI